jgi:uncharacterized membrane protein (DUF485 family)
MFIVPALIVFLLNFFAFSVLVGYAPKAASIKVIGAVNLGYLYALWQFVLGWTIAGLYLAAAAKFDRLSQDVLKESKLAPPAADPRGGR